MDDVVIYGQVYKITNDINNKVYIGQTITILGSRLKQHIKEAIKFSNCGSLLYKAIRKYGKESFTIIQIGQAIDKKSLDILERYYVAFYRKLLGRGNVYNITDGGEGNGGCLKNIPLSEEHKKNIGKALEGKHKSEEHKKKLRECKTEEYKQQFKESTHTPEVNSKRVKTRKESGKPWHSEETKQHMRHSHAKHPEGCQCISCRAERGELKSEDNSMFGKHYITIYNSAINKEKRIEPILLSEYFGKGWVRGRRPRNISTS
jgi:group I intron endonuclease